MSFRKYFGNLLFALVILPTSNQGLWKSDSYRDIPKNIVSFLKEDLQIGIRSSASPLFFKLENVQKISGFKVEGRFSSLPKFLDVTKQGEKGSDDFPLRIGFVVAGEKRLSVVQRMFAADWVKRVYELVPDGQGLDHVQFYNVVLDESLLGRKRKHPASDLLREEYFAFVGKPGNFKFQHKLNKPLDILAIWLSVDGDDTKSEYDVSISKLELLQ